MYCAIFYLQRGVCGFYFLDKMAQSETPTITVSEVASFHVPDIATVNYFPKAITSVTTLFVPTMAVPISSPTDSEPAVHNPRHRKSLLEEILEVDSLPSKINKKLRKRRKSSANKRNMTPVHDEYIANILNKSLTAEEDLKSIRRTLVDAERSQLYVSSKITELRGRIDSLCSVTARIGNSFQNAEAVTREMKNRQRVLQEECYEMLLQLESSRWEVTRIEEVDTKQLGPNAMGKHFQIHVKTNIEKLQLQSYVIHKKFRDIIQLYEDIEAADPEGRNRLLTWLPCSGTKTDLKNRPHVPPRTLSHLSRGTGVVQIGSIPMISIKKNDEKSNFASKSHCSLLQIKVAPNVIAYVSLPLTRESSVILKQNCFFRRFSL
eukprot:sb/3465714/